MNKLEVDFCKYHYVKVACKKWHYSRSVPPTKINVGVWENDSFIGVVLFGPGANKNLLRPYGLEIRNGCELIRIALKEHKSFVSEILSKSIKLVKLNYPEIHLVVSYADENQKHLGKIYQATNWIYVGKVNNSSMLINGKQLHSKTIWTKYGTCAINNLKKWVLMLNILNNLQNINI